MLAAFAGKGEGLRCKSAVPLERWREVAGKDGVIASAPVVQGGIAGHGGGAPPNLCAFRDQVGVGFHQSQIEERLGEKSASARIELALQVVAFAGKALPVGVEARVDPHVRKFAAEAPDGPYSVYVMDLGAHVGGCVAGDDQDFVDAGGIQGLSHRQGFCRIQVHGANMRNGPVTGPREGATDPGPGGKAREVRHVDRADPR
nr:hypothetical protein [Deinococcus geothermalis]